MIRVDNISKKFSFPTGGSGEATLKGRVVEMAQRVHRALKQVDREDVQIEEDSQREKANSFSVLEGVSMNIAAGETVALIGRNGCGKSTLLKILAGIYMPDSGSVQVDGRVSALIELGAGFHPEFSGRENIFINGQILGLSRKKVRSSFDEIVEFAGVGKFIDMPVRTYSSGMFMRLAFSVAVNVNPDVLLIDEILAVGDADFQAKCYKKMDEFKRAGKTIVIVTHSLNIVESWASRAIYIDAGRVKYDGVPADAVRRYLSELRESAENQNVSAEAQAAENQRSRAHRKDLERNYPEAQIANITEYDCAVSHSIEFIENNRQLVAKFQLNVDDLSFAERELLEIGYRFFNHDSTILLVEAYEQVNVPQNSKPRHIEVKIDTSSLNGSTFHVAMVRKVGHKLEYVMEFTFRLVQTPTGGGIFHMPSEIKAVETT